MRCYANNPTYPNRKYTDFREALPINTKSWNDGPQAGQFKLILAKVEAFNAEHDLLMDLGRLVDVYELG